MLAYCLWLVDTIMILGIDAAHMPKQPVEMGKLFSDRDSGKAHTARWDSAWASVKYAEYLDTLVQPSQGAYGWRRTVPEV
jgi:hypothetical protein